MTLSQRIIAYASWYIGKKEKKKNSGFEDPAFEKELKSAGWYKGGAWCAFFVKMVAVKALKDDLVLQKAVVEQFNGSAKQTYDRVKAAGVLETGKLPEPGCVVIWLHGDGPAGHAAFVETVNIENNTMGTIEGNTNGAGSREGDQVADKLRTIDRPAASGRLNVYGYIYLRRKKK